MYINVSYPCRGPSEVNRLQANCALGALVAGEDISAAGIHTSSQPSNLINDNIMFWKVDMSISQGLRLKKSLL